MTSQDLQTLYTNLQKQVNTQQQLAFVNALTALKLTNSASAYASFVPDKQLTIDTAVITMPDQNTILIAGATDSFGFSATPSTITFYITSSILYSDLDVSFSGQQLSLPGVNWFSIGLPVIKTTTAEAGLPVIGWAGGTIAAGFDLEVLMQFPIVNNTWVFQGIFQPDPVTKQYPNISNIFQLVGGINLSAALPQPFSTLTDLGLQTIDVQYNEATSTVDYIALNIVTDPTWSWKILPGLSVTGIAINCTVTAPGDAANRAASFTITGDLTIGAAGSNTLQVSATVPNFSASVILEEGAIQLGDLFGLFLPGVTIDLNSAITAFNLTIAPSSQTYLLSCGIQSDWTFLTIGSSLSFTLTALGLTINSQQGTASGQIGGTFHIGPPPSGGTPSGVDITVFAGYTGTGWTYGGSTGTGQLISLIDIAFTFLKPFGIDTIPSWVSNGGVVLDIENVSFTALVPNASTNTPSTYHFTGEVIWQLVFGSFNFSVDATVDITYTNSAASGSIIGDVTLFGLDFTIGYLFGSSTTEVYLIWKGIKCDYTSVPVTGGTKDTITITFTNMSLGSIITDLIASFDKGFTLPAPWNVLNTIDLSGLSLTYVRNTADSTQDTMTLTYSNSIDLVFITLSNITLTKDTNGVYLSFEGTFLGIPISASSEDPNAKKLAGNCPVQDLPSVPGLGTDFFDLHFLALGQHISIYQAGDLSNVEAAIDAMEAAVKTAPSSSSTAIPISAASGSTQPGTLVFDDNSNWLIGADFTVAKFYRMAIVFNDPNIYGLMITVDKTAQYFGNLYFEILYKKINDSIGVYQVDLQVPDEFRTLQFGAVSVTLPVIGIQIYTNGNFYLDFGFPASITDFSRSFTVQVFPFLGSGGFYFGYLSGATSTSVPATTCGSFNPVIEFGLGLSLGVGKTIDAGILQAGLSLTAVGIFQGVLGFFTANPSMVDTHNEVYYWLQGTMGLTGRIYGTVNFAIISAQFDITAYIYISITIESYMSIPISFTAGVSVSLTITINLGLFKIHISFSFSATISASFTIGTDHTQDAPWNTGRLPSAARTMRLASPNLLGTPAVLKWQPLIWDTGTQPLVTLYFMPHLTISSEGTPGPQYVAMIYTDSPKSTDTSTGSLGSLAVGALSWAINALLNSGQTNTKVSALASQTVTNDDLALLLCWFNSQPNSAAPFNYSNSDPTNLNDIQHFIQAYFTFMVKAIDPDSSIELTASVFPPFPEMQLQTSLNGTLSGVTDFSVKSPTGTQNYITGISQLLQSLSVNYESGATSEYYDNSICSQVTDPTFVSQENLSFPTFLLTDFFSLVTKQMIQNALDYVNTNGATLPSGQKQIVISDLITGVNTISAIQNLAGMASRFLMHGMRLPIPPDPTTTTIQQLYVITGQQFSIPLLASTDKYMVMLLKNPAATWLGFDGGGNSLSIPIGPNDIQRISDIRTISLSPTYLQQPAAMVNYYDRPQSFTVGNDIVWQYPGNYFGVAGNPSIWKLPSTLQTILASNTNPALSFDLKTITPSGDTITRGVIKLSSWSTIVNVNVQKISAGGSLSTPISGNMYNLIGADDTGIVYLQNIIAYMNSQGGGSDSFISQVQILYQPAATSSSSGGYISAANGALNAAIVQANLSTETNPTASLSRTMLTSTPERNTLNTFGDFITKLWECSIVRSGGFYFYYITTADGKGLPDALFNENGTGQLQFLITYNSFLPQSFLNTVIIGDQFTGNKPSVYAQSDSILVRSALLSQGSVGYQSVVQYPGDYQPPSTGAPSRAQDQIYLNNQFNLVGMSLPGIANYYNLLPSGPSNSLDENGNVQPQPGITTGGPNDWSLSGVIQYNKYVQPSTNTSPDPAFLDPYAGVGTNVKIQLNWQDMFGNQQPLSWGSPATSQVNMFLGYTDTLQAVSQWPSVSTYYVFGSAGNQPQITLGFCFNTGRYTGAAAKNNATADLLIYMQLYYQLIHSSDIIMFFNTSIDGSASAPAGSNRTIDTSALLKNFVLPIAQYLYYISNPTTPAANPPANPYLITSGINPANIAAYSDTFALTTSITLQRTTNIDPNFNNPVDPSGKSLGMGVVTAITTVQPLSKNDPCNNDTSALSLIYFSQQFETAFLNQPNAGINLKVATSTGSAAIGTSVTPPVWVVRFDTTGVSGIQYTFDTSQVFFFAPIPLALTLQTINANIFPYQTGTAYPAGNSVAKTFTSIDLDVWGAQLLDAIDTFLSPAYAVPAFLLDNGTSLSQVLQYKEQLAEAIEGTIDSIMALTDAQKAAANYGNAQENWKQQILNQLSNAYRYVASVQTPVTIKSGYTGSNNNPPQAPFVPWLYGNMVGNGPYVPDDDGVVPASTDYSLSTSKVPLGKGASWLSYMFQARQASNSRSFAFKEMNYQVSHIEQQIQNVEGISDYLASTWLTFVIPLDPTLGQIGPVVIPVPLRAYPTPPSITLQGLDYPVNDTTGENYVTLAQARNWTYEYNYQNAVAAQDTIETQVQFNIPASATMMTRRMATDPILLPEALAQFISAYPAISADLKMYLAQLTPKDVAGNTPTFTKAQFAVDAFSSIISVIATAWGSWNQVNPRNTQKKPALKTPVSVSPTLNFTVVETGQAVTDALVVTITPDPKNQLPVIPAITIAGYTAVPVPKTPNAFTFNNVASQPLLYIDRNIDPIRTVSLPNLDILLDQNAWAGVQVLRNQDLLQNNDGSWQTTNSLFVYQTPMVKFYDKLIPLLSCNGLIDISQIATVNYPVITNRPLQNNMRALCEALTDGVVQSSLTIKLQASYEYNLIGMNNTIALPVVLATPFQLTTGDQGQAFADSLTGVLTQWLTNHNPNNNAAQWSFTIEAYSSFDPNKPILIIDLVLAL